MRYIKNVLKKLNDDSVVETLVRIASGTFFIKLAGAALLFLMQVYLAKVLDLESYGFYTYTMALLGLSTLFILGFEMAIVRFVAIYTSLKSPEAIKGIYKRFRKIIFIISIIISISGLFVLIILRDKIGSEQLITMIIASILVPIYSAVPLLSGVLRGLQRVIFTETQNQILRPILVITFVFIFSSIFNPFKSYHVLGITLVVFTIIFFILRKSVHNNEFMNDEYKEKYYTKEWLYAVFPLTLFSGMDFLQKNTDILMVGAIIGTNESGMYTVATRVTDLCVFGMLAVNSIAAPLFSKLYSENNFEKLQKLINVATRISFSITIFFIFFLVIFVDEVLLLFGKDFVATYPVVFILLISQLVNAFSGPVSLVLTMTGYYKALTTILLIGLIINILFNLLLLQVMGIEGAATATAISKTFNSVVLIIYIRRKLKIKTSLF